MFQLQNMSQVNQDVLDLPDWDAALRESGYLMGVPAKFMKSKAKVNEARKEREAMQAAQMQAQLAETQGKANKLDSEAEAARSQEGI
jgi:hypothetical protein